MTNGTLTLKAMHIPFTLQPNLNSRSRNRGLNVRFTATALFSIDPVLKKVAEGMGLTTAQQLRYIEFPLAAPTILAGIKTAAVINIGTATLAAFIGAGGLGEPIVTGLALNDTTLILEGAVPAAVLAIATELVFEGIERWTVPRHLTGNTGK